ncbi:hypothetical protein VTN96DRAFT_1696 [Rasamsonia emersonii]
MAKSEKLHSPLACSSARRPLAPLAPYPSSFSSSALRSLQGTDWRRVNSPTARTRRGFGGPIWRGFCWSRLACWSGSLAQHEPRGATTPTLTALAAAPSSAELHRLADRPSCCSSPRLPG